MIKINEDCYGEILEMKINKEKRVLEFFYTDYDITGRETKTKTKTISFDFLSGATF